MKKFLFAMLGLLFTISANAGCNLFNGYNSAAVTLDETNNVLSNKVRDTRTNFQLQVQMQKTDNSYFIPINQADIATGKQTFTFNVPEDIKYFAIKHNGVTQDIKITPDTLLPSAGTYTLSFDVLSNDPTTVGGLQLQNIKLERGSTATLYTPYDANCVERCANLYNYSDINSSQFELVDGNTLRNTSTTNNTRFQLSIYDSVNREMAASNVFTTPGNYNVKFNVVRDNNTMSMYHSGSNGNLGFFTSRKINPGEYVLSFDLLSANPSVVGGLQLKNISLQPAYCSEIQVASTKYVETQFSDLNSRLAAAVATVNTVVTNTINQAASIATLQSGKQTRPNDIADNSEKCPAYKQCLLVEDENGTPHWYQITDPFRDFVAPIIANNVAPASTTNQPGFTQLEYIQSTGTQWIDTGIKWRYGYSLEMAFTPVTTGVNTALFGASNGSAYDGGEVSLFFQRNGYDVIWPTTNNTTSTFQHFGTFAPNTKYVAQYNNSGITIGQTALGFSVYSGYVGERNLFLFATNRGEANSYPTRLKIHSTRIWNNGTLVRNFIPAKRNSDGAIGMYDTVTKTFFANAGTGTFTAGPTVANTDVPANPTWSATWTANASNGVTAGTVSGEALCNAVSGTYGIAATSSQLSNANWNTTGAGCWCKASGLTVGEEYSAASSSSWVFYYTFGSTAGCASDCALNCANNVRSYAEFRSAVFGM